MPLAMTTADTRRALRAMLMDAAHALMPPADRIAWEGRTFDPPTGFPWLRETFSPISAPVVSRPVTVREGWLYLLEFYAPPTTPVTDLDDAADAIRTALRPGRRVGMDGLIERADRASLQPSPDWNMVPITVRGWTMRRP